MATDDDSTLSVTGTAHLGRTDEQPVSLGLTDIGMAAMVLLLAGVTALTSVETGNAIVGLGLLTAVGLAVCTVVALEFGRRLD